MDRTSNCLTRLARRLTNTSASKVRKATQEAGMRMLDAMVDVWAERFTAMLLPQRPSPIGVTISGLFQDGSGSE